MQECGPRFTLKLISLQHGTFDTKGGEYEWVHKVSSFLIPISIYLLYGFDSLYLNQLLFALTSSPLPWILAGDGHKPQEIFLVTCFQFYSLSWKIRVFGALETSTWLPGFLKFWYMLHHVPSVRLILNSTQKAKLKSQIRVLVSCLRFKTTSSHYLQYGWSFVLVAQTVMEHCSDRENLNE